MRIAHISVLIPLLVAFASCVPAGGTAGRSPAAADPGAWEIELGVSGGIAGIRQQLSVRSSGELNAADLRHDKRVALRATPAQVTRISGILSRLGAEATLRNAPRLPGRCRDCINYTLKAVVDGRRHQAVISSMAVKDSQYAELLTALSAMLREALAAKSD